MKGKCNGGACNACPLFSSFPWNRWWQGAGLPPPLPGRSQFPRKRWLRKVRTPQGNAPHESEGREPRGTRTDSAAERYRRWPARAQARVKWWSKSPPRIRVTGRHGKPRVVQDRTGEGRPARYKPRVIVALRASGALRSGGVREMTVQLRASGVDRIRLTGERHLFHTDRKQGERSRANHQPGLRRRRPHPAWTERSAVNPAYRGAALLLPRGAIPRVDFMPRSCLECAGNATMLCPAAAPQPL